MQPLSPGRLDHTVCPHSSCVLAEPGGPVQRSTQTFSPTPWVGSGGPSRCPQPLRSYYPWFGSLLLQGNPTHLPTHREPHGRQEDTLVPFWQLLPAANSCGWSQARLWGEWWEKQEGLTWWSAPSSDLRPASFWEEGPVPSSSITCSSYPPPPSPIPRAPVALLWIRVTRGGVRMQVTGLQPQRFDSGGYTSGAWEFEFLTNNPVGFDARGPLNTCWETFNRPVTHICEPLVKSANEVHTICLNI